MRWRRPPKPERAPGEYPETFVKGWMARALPMATPSEAASAVRHLRSKGWTEQDLAEFIRPYMPRGVPWPDDTAADAEVPRTPQPVGAPTERVDGITLPPDVTKAWLDQYLPALDRRQIRLVVDELEGRGWASGTVAMAVLPHLLPKLPAEEARAVISGLRDLGMTEEEITRATAVG